MELRFLSADGWRPEGVESDTVSLLLNGEVMVDTGWHAVHNLLREKIPIENVRTLLLTHLHQDHRMGLPALLFYLLNSHQNAGSISIYGLAGVEEIVHKALDYAGKFQDYVRAPGPVVRVLKAGDNLQAAGLTIRTAASHHSVPGLMYRFEDEAGHVLVYSGDTAPSQETVLFAEGADVLVHEHSWGAARPENLPNACGHSSAEDAARVAKAAGVGRLYLVHAAPDTAAESLTRARAIFPETFRAQAGKEILL